jgi:hypothetical protein
MRLAWCQLRMKEGESTIMLTTQSRASFTLSTLLTHPEVQRGMQDARNAHEEWIFESSDQEVFADLQTEEDAIRFLNEELSGASYLREKETEQRSGKAIDSYYWYIGFALSWLDQAMSYHQQQKASVPQ